MMTLDKKVDHLVETVDVLVSKFGELDKKFDAIDQRFGEMNHRFDTMDQRFVAIDQRFDAMDQRFVAIDQRFDAMDQRFVAIDQRFDAMDQRFVAIDQRFDNMDQQFEDLAISVKNGFDDVYERLDKTVTTEHFDEVVTITDRRLDIIENISTRGHERRIENLEDKVGIISTKLKLNRNR